VIGFKIHRHRIEKEAGEAFSVIFLFFLFLFSFLFQACSQKTNTTISQREDIDPTSLLWYTHPADKWENALPVGNGRLGAMVFGRTDEETIQFNEETYWSGGPYSQTVMGGYKALPEIQRLIFEGKYIPAHKLFGRHLMGYPVEQQKYQSFGDLILNFAKKGQVMHYVHQLDLDQGINKMA
jgi:alpha-L-fucosidase 2